MVDISKADWKLFCKRVPDWQEHYMEGLIQEYIEMLSSPGNASDHFWELEKRIKSDRKHPGVLLELRKSDKSFSAKCPKASESVLNCP